MAIGPPLTMHNVGYGVCFVFVLDILLAKAADDSIAAVESHGFLIIVDPSQHQKDWT